MSVQVYAGGVLAYDNRLPTEKRYTVQSILIEEIANKGGAATIILPPGHPAYDAFAPMKTLVEIYRNGRLRWRGRPLPVPEDVYGRRTVVCEGELCFLQDAIQRPYSYYGDPASVFTQIMDGYNAAVDPWKRFVVGDVTVSCENGFLALASTSAEKVSVTVNKLITQYGGLILFDSAEDGARRINWYADFPYTCNQQIRYGYNLIDYSSKPDATDFATRIIPYGAEGADGNRIKINANGKDYVENAEAVAKFGVIEKAVIYDGITDAAELQAKAEQDVGKLSDIPQTIHLTALDMSKLDIALDAFAMGQKVEASSAQHRLSGFYGITSLTEDLVNPSVGSVTLIREVSSHGNSIFTEQFTGLVTSKDEMESVAQSKVDAQTQADIFNKLTKNGEIHGLFMKDGQLYINALYILTNSFTATAEAYLPPTYDDVMGMAWSLSFPDRFPPKDIYDLNGDGSFDVTDVRLAENIYLGKANIEDCPGVQRTEVTVTIDPSDSERAILITGTNMWGSEITVSVGACGSNIPAIRGNCSIGGKLAVGDSAIVKMLATEVSQTPKALSWKDNGDGTFTLIGS